MKTIKYLLAVSTVLVLAYSCKKDLFTDISFVAKSSIPAKISVMFDITQDNTGLVTLTPGGEGVTSYEVFFGDNTTNSVSIVPGGNIKHTYAEGVYTVKVLGHGIGGQTTTATQTLTVSYKAPTNLVVKVSKSSLSVSVTSTAKYETFLQVFYGDSNSVNPIPYSKALDGQTLNHTYANAGTYIIKVVALSGGAETTQFLDTVTVAKQIDLPVTFDDPNYDYTVTNFGGATTSIIIDPTTPGNHVMKVIKPLGAANYAGTTLGTNNLGFATPIPISYSSTKMSVRVFAPDTAIDIKLKIEDHTNPNHSVEKDVKTTLKNQFETIVFDFKTPTPGTAAINTSYIYDKATIFMDFGNNGDGRTYYFDDVKVLPPALLQISLPITFDDPKVDYSFTDFGGNSSKVVPDPVNAANNVLMSTKTVGAATYAGTTLTTALGFSSPAKISTASSKMTVRVYSPAIGIDVKLKMEDHSIGAHSVETDVKTTMSGAWETLVFDFVNNAPNTPAINAGYNYDKATIFFDFGNTGDGRVYYCDDIRFLQQVNLPVTFDDLNTEYVLADFGGNSSVITSDPTGAANMVAKSTKTAGAATYAGTTMTNSYGFASPIPITATRTKMTVMVYSPAVGIDVKLKIEDPLNSANSVETDVKTTKSGAWETLVFDFTNNATGTPALNPSFTYGKATIFFDFGNAGDGRIYYWDNVTIL